MNVILRTITRHRISILLIAIAAVVVSVDIALIKPFEYRSQFSIIVIEKAENLDAYAAAKSSERMTLSLSQVLSSQAFADDVIDTGFTDASTVYGADVGNEQKRRTAWKHMVETRTLADVGYLSIAVFHEDRGTAQNMANALAAVLVDHGRDYVGGGNSVVIKVVDSPVTSEKPVRPNIPLAVLFGIVVGVCGSVGFYIVRDKSWKKGEAESGKDQTSSEQNPAYGE